MDITIAFNPTEEARLVAAAQRTGLAPADLLKRLALEHLPAVPANDEGEIDARLHQWQEQDQTALQSENSSGTLFSQWAEEDAQMTDAEREAEDRLWEDIEQGLTANGRTLRLRWPGA